MFVTFLILIVTTIKFERAFEQIYGRLAEVNYFLV